MMFARFRARGAKFLDDRGEPLALPPHRELANRLGVRWVSAIFWIFALTLLALWLIYSAPLGTSPLSLQQSIFFFTMALVIPLARMSLASLNTSRLTPLAAQLTAHGVCGACGYDLRACGVQADGCVVCPECGAAWHRDRFVLGEKPKLESPSLRALVKKGHVTKDWHEAADDRGMLLDQHLRWPPCWLGTGKAPPELEERFVAAARMRIRRFWKVAIPTAIVLWAVAVPAFSSTSHARDVDQVMFVIFITGLIMAFALWAAWRVY